MKNNLVYILLIAIAVSFIAFYSLNSGQDNYAIDIQKSRDEYINFLKKSASSPIKDKKKFKGPKFYTPNTHFRVQAQVEEDKERGTRSIMNTNGESTVYTNYALLKFQLKGQKCVLTLFKSTKDEGDYFLPFGDETNGQETYGAGRYVPVLFKPGSKQVEIDFNRASNPYCAYNEAYICPLPPKENYLSLKIEAGEKAFQKY